MPTGGFTGNGFHQYSSVMDWTERKITIQIQPHENLRRKIVMSKKGMAQKNSQTYCWGELGDRGEKKPNESLTKRNAD